MRPSRRNSDRPDGRDERPEKRLPHEPPRLVGRLGAERRLRRNMIPSLPDRQRLKRAGPCAKAAVRPNDHGSIDPQDREGYLHAGRRESNPRGGKSSENYLGARPRTGQAISRRPQAGHNIVDEAVRLGDGPDRRAGRQQPSSKGPRSRTDRQFEELQGTARAQHQLAGQTRGNTATSSSTSGPARGFAEREDRPRELPTERPHRSTSRTYVRGTAGPADFPVANGPGVIAELFKMEVRKSTTRITRSRPCARTLGSRARILRSSATTRQMTRRCLRRHEGQPVQGVGNELQARRSTSSPGTRNQATSW